jgi:hypothetical protein
MLNSTANLHYLKKNSKQKKTSKYLSLKKKYCNFTKKKFRNKLVDVIG